MEILAKIKVNRPKIDNNNTNNIRTIKVFTNRSLVKEIAIKTQNF